DQAISATQLLQAFLLSGAERTLFPQLLLQLLPLRIDGVRLSPPRLVRVLEKQTIGFDIGGENVLVELGCGRSEKILALRLKHESIRFRVTRQYRHLAEVTPCHNQGTVRGDDELDVRERVGEQSHHH